MALDDALRAITVIGSGLGAGILVTVSLVLTPVERSLERAFALRFKNAQDPLIDRLNPPLIVVATIAGAVLLAVGDLSDAALALTAIALVGMIGIPVLSFGFNIPLNRRMQAMPELDPPAEFEQLFARWTRLHNARTAFGVLGFVAYVVAALPGIA